MEFIIGFAVWFVIGLIGGWVARLLYRADHTVTGMALAFGVFGAFIGGMLANAAYVHHDPMPLRTGGLIGAVLGAVFFPFVYQFIGRKFV